MKRVCLPVILSLSTAACIHRDDAAREMKSETHNIELGRAESVNAKIEFPAGEFELRGGATKLLEGQYRFDSEGLRPVVDYQADGSTGELKITTAPKMSAGSAHARWETRLNNQVPLNLDLRVAAGKVEAVAGTLNLRRLTVNYGAGELTLDLRGKAQGSYEVEVHGGVGLGRIYVPGGAGVEVEVHKGIGSVSVDGELRQDGQRYYNALWGKSDKQVRIQVHSGVGKIELIAAE